MHTTYNTMHTQTSSQLYTIKGGSPRAEKSRKVVMMMKAAKLGWAGSGAGQEQAWSMLGAGQEQCKSREEARVGQEH